MKKEQFAKIYEAALLRCKIKCVNRHVKGMIKNIRDGVYAKNPEGDYKTIQPMLKKRYWEMYCRECKCVPDSEYMYSEIKKNYRRIKNENIGRSLLFWKC